MSVTKPAFCAPQKPCLIHNTLLGTPSIEVSVEAAALGHV